MPATYRRPGAPDETEPRVVRPAELQSMLQPAIGALRICLRFRKPPKIVTIYLNASGEISTTMKWDASSSPATAGLTSRQVAMMNHAAIALARRGPMVAGHASRQSLSKGLKKKWPRPAFEPGIGSRLFCLRAEPSLDLIKVAKMYQAVLIP
jgi:hypothetical protein